MRDRTYPGCRIKKSDSRVNSCTEGTGWEAPNLNAVPLAGEDIDKVLKRFARLPAMQFGTRVLAVISGGFHKFKSAGRENSSFVRHAVQGQDVIEMKARAAIDSVGTGNHRKPVGASGMPVIGESESADRIAYGIPDLLGTSRYR